jgi:hypothetical protein
MTLWNGKRLIVLSNNMMFLYDMPPWSADAAPIPMDKIITKARNSFRVIMATLLISSKTLWNGKRLKVLYTNMMFLQEHIFYTCERDIGSNGILQSFSAHCS